MAYSVLKNENENRVIRNLQTCSVDVMTTCKVKLKGMKNLDCLSYLLQVTDLNNDDQCNVNISLKHRLNYSKDGCIELTSVTRDIDWNDVPSVSLIDNIPSDERTICQGDKPITISEKLIRNVNICNIPDFTNVEITANNECVGTYEIPFNRALPSISCEEIEPTLFKAEVTCSGTNHDGKNVSCEEIKLNKNNCNGNLKYTYTITNVHERGENSLFDLPAYILTARIKGGATQTFDVTDVVLEKKDDNIKFIQEYTYSACKKGFSQKIKFIVHGKTSDPSQKCKKTAKSRVSIKAPKT